MSSINTVSGNGNKNYVSGLASGMDTESIVKSLLMGTQTKIDKQSGLKQQLEWKQDIYRDLITKINTFSDKYFSYYGSGDTNLMSQSLFKTMTGISSSGENSILNPRPLHTGQAPKGLLKEKLLGSISSRLTPQSGHEKL